MARRRTTEAGTVEGDHSAGTRNRAPAAQRFARHSFTQLRPALTMAAEYIKQGNTPPTAIVQAAGALNAAIAEWVNQLQE